MAGETKEEDQQSTFFTSSADTDSIKARIFIRGGTLLLALYPSVRHLVSHLSCEILPDLPNFLKASR